MDDEKPSRLGRYELREVLGRGAMGVVYRAYDSFLDRIVAVKTYRQDIQFPEEARRRFEREVRTASKLSHPNVVVVYDGGLEEGIPYLAMEYIEGPTLEDEMKRRGRLPRAEALSMLLDIADGLAYAHRREVVHRDLKPANILLAPDGVPKIADFGVAKVLDAQTSTKTTTVGTPRYMAPEQIEGKSVGRAADIFSLGIIAYELLTGTRPFEADSLTGLLFQILSTDPRPPCEVDPSLPRALNEVLARALAKDPAKRTPDAETFAAELRQACGAEGLSPQPPPPPPPPPLPPPPPPPQPPPPPVRPPRFSFPDDSAFTEPMTEATAQRSAERTASSRGVLWAVVVLLVLVAGGIGAYLLGAFERSGAEPRGGAIAAPTSTPTVASATATPRPRATPTVLPSPAPAPDAVSPPVVRESPKLEPTATPVRKTPTPRPTPLPTRTPRPTATAEPEPEPPPPTPTPTRAAPPTAHADARGRAVEIVSEPSGAEVLIDGTVKGRTPLRIDHLPAGSYALEVRKAGFEPYEKTMNLDGISDYTVRVSLPPDVNGAGYVNVSSKPPGALVRLNGTPSGNTPANLGPLEPGRYEVSAEYPGFAVQTRTIEMGAGELHDVKFTFGASR